MKIPWVSTLLARRRDAARARQDHLDEAEAAARKAGAERVRLIEQADAEKREQQAVTDRMLDEVHNSTCQISGVFPKPRSNGAVRRPAPDSA